MKAVKIYKETMNWASNKDLTNDNKSAKMISDMQYWSERYSKRDAVQFLKDWLWDADIDEDSTNISLKANRREMREIFYANK